MMLPASWRGCQGCAGWKPLADAGRTAGTNPPVPWYGIYCGVDSTYGNDPGCSRYQALTGGRPGRASYEAEPLCLDSRRASRTSPEIGDPGSGGARPRRLCEGATDARGSAGLG